MSLKGSDRAAAVRSAARRRETGAARLTPFHCIGFDDISGAIGAPVFSRPAPRRIRGG
jgi:hypothetical protein